MADAAVNTDDPEQTTDSPAPKKRGGLILGVVLALLGGAGGFFATNFLLPKSQAPAEKPVTAEQLPDLAFVDLEPMIISLRMGGESSHLRFRIQLEVADPYQSDVVHLTPRIVDVVNGYLRALEPSDFEDPMILSKLRSQLLRRIQIVTGEGRVRDVLIMEFILT